MKIRASHVFLFAILPIRLLFAEESSSVHPNDDHETRYCMSMTFGSDTPHFHCTKEDSNLTYDEEGRHFPKNNKRIGTAITQRVDGK
jgi:hypothetical protein